jgi:hypothetical protein
VKVFTVAGGKSSAGAAVSNLPFYDAELKALIVGEEKNGCKLGVVKFESDPGVSKVSHVEVKESSGKYTVRATTSSKDSNKALIVLRTPVFQGGKNFHTGDRKTTVCLSCEVEYESFQDFCTICKRQLKTYFADFPGTILAKGTVRNSKKPIFGEQLICIVKKGVTFRTSYSGFVFGHPGAHFHKFDGDQISSLTWEEMKRTFFF